MSITRLCTISFAFCLFASTAWGQQDTVLPDLAPREVEITGDLAISFPALRRQPIAGFNPPPRVPDIPADREPYTEAYTQRSAALPPSPLIPPDPPQISGMAQRTPAGGQIEARIGAFLDRRIAAQATLVRTRKTTALLDVDYFGSDGHDVTVGGADATSGRDAYRGSLGLEHRTGALVMNLEAEGFRRSYGLFGAVPGAATISRPNPARKFGGYEGRVSFASAPDAAIQFRWETRTGRSHVQTDLFDPALRRDPATKREAGFAGTTFRVDLPVFDGNLRLSADAIGTGLDEASFPGGTVRSGLFSAEFSRKVSARLSAGAGATILGFDSRSQTGRDPARQLAYVAPIVDIAYAASSTVTVEAAVRSMMSSGYLRDIMEEVPVVMDEPVMLPSIATLDARLGVHFESKVASARVSGGWRDQPFHRLAAEPDAPLRGYTEGYPALSYRSADVLFSSVDLSMLPMEGLQIGLNALWQDATLASTGSSVPYVSPLAIGGFISLNLLGGDLESRLSLRYEASRTADTAGTIDVPSVTRINAQVAWFFHSNYSIMTGVRDLGPSQEFWRNYAYESTAFFLGLRYRW